MGGCGFGMELLGRGGFDGLGLFGGGCGWGGGVAAVAADVAVDVTMIRGLPS